jgi:hypothetical protein
MLSRLALGLVLVAALPVALAGDDDEVTLKLLPDPKKGQAEEIGFQISVSYSGETESYTGKLRREIRSVDEDGLAASELLEVLSGDYTHEQQNSSYSTSSSGGGAKTVERTGKSRLASEDVAGLDHVTFKHVHDVGNALRRDPDALARAIQPDDKMKVDDRWEVEPRDLLRLFVGGKTKLRDGSKAIATLESVKKKEDKSEASISLKATVLYIKTDDPDTPCRLSITASLRGPIDGSAPPRKEKVSFTVKEGDEKKFTEVVSLDRTPAEKDDDSDDDSKDKKDKKDDKKDEKKKDEKKKDD